MFTMEVRSGRPCMTDERGREREERERKRERERERGKREGEREREREREIPSFTQSDHNNDS